MATILNYFLLDLPEAMLLLFIGYAVFNLSIRSQWRRLLTCGALFSLWGDVLTSIGVDYQLKLLLFFSFELILFLVLGHRYKSIAMVIASSAWMMTSETLGGVLINSLEIDPNVFAGSSLLRYSLSYLYFSLLGLLSLVLYSFRFDLQTLWPRAVTTRYLLFLVVSGGLTFVSILFVNVSTFLGKVLPPELIPSTAHMWVYQLAALVLATITAVFFVLYVRATVVRVEKETEEPYSKQVYDLTTAVQSIKHDALNHYMVIVGFLKLKNYSSIESYVQSLIDEARQVISVVQGVKNTTVSAMLYSKMAIFAGEAIDFRMKVSAEAPQFSGWRNIHITKLLGNLLDNAYSATMKLEPEERYIHVEWGNSEGVEYFFIENSGPTIPAEKLPLLFNLGYTTRESGKGGVGLPVVKSLVLKYKGEISVSSSNGVTRFTVKLPIADKNSTSNQETA